ncbi:Hypothetical predicted protein [Octopus vulgaris]|uniref:Uncharacterized protein n=1 Tax=Octopus vulgaris TaxID=6645 RepID=A0AA36EYW6_OCTVU|nr:Hypothetical predicted protein [Octopus vulgaris]
MACCGATSASPYDYADFKDDDLRGATPTVRIEDDDDDAEFDLMRPLGSIPVLRREPRPKPSMDIVKRKSILRSPPALDPEDIAAMLPRIPKGYRLLCCLGPPPVRMSRAHPVRTSRAPPSEPSRAPSLELSQQLHTIDLPASDKRLSISTQLEIQEFLNAIKSFEEELELEEAELKRNVNQIKWYSSYLAAEGDISTVGLMDRTRYIPEFKEELFLGDKDYEESLSDFEERSDAMDQTVVYVPHEAEKEAFYPIPEEEFPAVSPHKSILSENVLGKPYFYIVLH